MLLPDGAPPLVQALFWTGYLAIFVFVLANMFVTGLSVTPGDLLAPVRNRRLITLALFTNFVAVPLLAILLTRLIPMNGQLAGGLLLCAIAAGAPSTGKVAEITGGDIARAVSLTILMILATIALMPLLLPLALPGARADILVILFYLVVLILVPILLGLLLRDRAGHLASRILPAAGRVSDLSILVIFLTIGIVFLSRLGDFAAGVSGTAALSAALLFTLGALGLGYLFGGLSGDSRQEIAVSACFRNITAVLVVIFASYAIGGRDLLLMVLMVTFVSVVVVSVLVSITYRRRYGMQGVARWFRSLAGRASHPPGGPGA